MELIFLVASAVVLAVCVAVGLAVGSGVEGPEPGPAAASPRNLRITRAALLATAALISGFGAEAAVVAGSLHDPGAGRSLAAVFLLEAAADLVLAAILLLPAWTSRHVWVLRMIAVCWLIVGPPGLILDFGNGPEATFYLGIGPDVWAMLALVSGAVLVWLATLGGSPMDETAVAGATAATADINAGGASSDDTLPSTALEPGPRPESPAASVAAARPRRVPTPPTHWRGIVTGVALASLLAISAWPAAQFAGVIVLGGCTPQWLVPSDPAFCVSGRVDGRNLAISGDTTLPDGALVDLEASGVPAGVGSGNLPLQRIAVAAGKFQATFSLSSSSATSVVATATFKMDGQPPATVELYGADGHGLTGPVVTRAGSGRSLEVTLTFDLQH